MNRAIAGFCLMAAVLLPGCVPSLHPLYTEEDLVFEPGLAGTWIDPENDTAWTFAPGDGKTYAVTYVEGGKPGRFEGHLVRIGGKLLLDLHPEDPDIDANDFYRLHLVPAHTFLRVDLGPDTLALRPLHPEWIAALLEKDPKAVAHEKIRGGDIVILTAQPRDLQAFLRKHLDAEGAFMEPAEYRRKAEKPAGGGGTGPISD